MGANDAAEMLDAAKAECVRLEVELANARSEATRQKRRADEAWDTISTDWWRNHYDALNDENARLQQVIEQAPHHGFCSALYFPTWPCTCWKEALSQLTPDMNGDGDEHH